MKKENSKSLDDADDDLLPEYDFRGGVRGNITKLIVKGIPLQFTKWMGQLPLFRKNPIKKRKSTSKVVSRKVAV